MEFTSSLSAYYGVSALISLDFIRFVDAMAMWRKNGGNTVFHGVGKPP